MRLRVKRNSTSSARVTTNLMIDAVCKHTYKNTVEAIAESCTTNGIIEHYICEDCGDYLVLNDGAYVKVEADSVIIPATGHNVVVSVGVPATCTEGGLSDETFCSVCGVILNAR